MPMSTPDEQREYQREWVRKRREEYFKDKRCVLCTSTINLELDHIDPSLKISHSIWSWSEEKRNEELAKCQILCRTCHRRKTNKDMGWGQVHGTTTSYKNYRCRCSLCRKAWRKYRYNQRHQ